MERVELYNGRVIDVLSGRPYPEDVRVLIEGKTIAALPGLDGNPEVPPDRRLDLGGRTVIPGLFNTHVHVTMPTPGLQLRFKEMKLPMQHGREQVRTNLTKCLERGITHVRDTLCEDLRHSRRLKSVLSSGELLGPRLHQAVLVSQPGGTFTAKRNLVARHALPKVGLSVLEFDDTDSGVMTFAANASEADVRAAVDHAIDERGADCIKLYDQREKKFSYRPGASLMTQWQLDAAADQARKRNVESIIHQVTVESFRRAVRAGVSTLSHVPIDSPLTERDARAFVDAGCMIEPTATLVYFYSLAPEVSRNHPRITALDEIRRPKHWQRLEELWAPALRPVLRDSMRRLVEGKRWLFGVMPAGQIYRYFARIITHGFDNIQLLWKAAGPDRFACGNDAGPNPSTPAGIWLEIEMLDFCVGLSGADALRIATVNSAKALGIEKSYGTIETGKVADLVVLDGDPLSNTGLLGEPVAALFLEGELVIDHCGLAKG